MSFTNRLYFLIAVLAFAVVGITIARGQTTQFEFFPQIDGLKHFTDKVQGGVRNLAQKRRRHILAKTTETGLEVFAVGSD